MIKTEVLKDLTSVADNRPLIEVVEALTKALHEAQEDGYMNVRTVLSIEKEYESCDDRPVIEIHGEREETAPEMKVRVDSEKFHKKQKAVRDRQTYEVLKARFEPEGQT